MLRRFLLLSVGVGTLTGGIACKHCRSLRDKDRAPPSPPPMFDDPVPSRGGRIPAPNVPTTPDTLPPPVIPDRRDSFFRGDLPPSPGSWVAPKGDLPRLPSESKKKELIFPDPIIGSSKAAPPVIDLPAEKKVEPRVYLEEPIRPADKSDLPGATPKPPAPVLDAPTAGSQAGLPGFAKIPGHANVATGRKPTLDGFDWLKANNYRGIVYVHAPGTDPAPARDLAAKRGLSFTSVSVSPTSLRTAFETFTKELADAAGKPIYVADADEKAGYLWYLYFRTADFLGDDAARVRAAPLGLPEATTDEQKQFWIAVQDYLANR